MFDSLALILIGVYMYISYTVALSMRVRFGLAVGLMVVYRLVRVMKKPEQKPLSVEDKSKVCESYARDKCRIPVATSERCYYQEHKNCNYEMIPGDPHRLIQCANNNLDTPNDLTGKCNGRIDETTMAPMRIDEKCYDVAYEECMLRD